MPWIAICVAGICSGAESSEKKSTLAENCGNERIYLDTISARPSSLGSPPRARHRAHTMVDFPLPFGPMMKFSLGPG